MGRRGMGPATVDAVSRAAVARSFLPTVSRDRM